MRLELSTRSDLALRALAELSPSFPTAGHVIADRIETTVSYLPHLFRPLTSRGWVRGTPGPGGGYQLVVGLGEISVLEVIEAMEGKTEDDKCVLRGVPCPVPEPCVMHDSWFRARGALLAELDATSVATTLASAPTKGE